MLRKKLRYIYDKEKVIRGRGVNVKCGLRWNTSSSQWESHYDSISCKINNGPLNHLINIVIQTPLKKSCEDFYAVDISSKPEFLVSNFLPIRSSSSNSHSQALVQSTKHITAKHSELCSPLAREDEQDFQPARPMVNGMGSVVGACIV